MSRGTPHRAIRIDAELWEQVKTQAANEGITVSDLIRGLTARMARPARG